MWHMGDNMGWWMIAGWIWMIGFWALAIWAVSTFVGRHSSLQHEPTRQAGSDASRMLDQRYATGEIDDDEYVRRRNRLNETPVP